MSSFVPIQVLTRFVRAFRSTGASRVKPLSPRTVGRPAPSPVTARYGESYKAFWWRTMWGQFRFAFRYEVRRFGNTGLSWSRVAARHLRGNRVVHGLLIELAITLLTYRYFGGTALAVFLGQVLLVARLLQIRSCGASGLDRSPYKGAYAQVIQMGNPASPRGIIEAAQRRHAALLPSMSAADIAWVASRYATGHHLNASLYR